MYLHLRIKVNKQKAWFVRIVLFSYFYSILDNYQ